MRPPQRFVVLPFSARVASGARFGTLPGSILGARSLATVLRSLLACPRAAQEYFCSAPEASKSAPRGQLEGKIRAQKGQLIAKRLPGWVRDPFLIDFESIFDRFCDPIWSRMVPSWEHSVLHSAPRSTLHSVLHSPLHSALHSDLHSAPLELLLIFDQSRGGLYNA